MRKSLNKIRENLKLVEVERDGESLRSRVERKLGLKKFKLSFEDVNCYGVTYTYATVKTSKSALTFRYRSSYSSRTIELPRELV